MEQSMVPNIIISNTILIAIASAGVAVRLFVQCHQRKFGADTILCVISWIFAFLICVTSCLMTRYGYGRHIAVVGKDIPKMAVFLKLVVVTAISYLVALTAIKISIAILYMKLFAVLNTSWIYWVVIAVLVCQFIEEFFVFIFQCWPVQKLVDPTGAIQGRCIDLYIFYIISFVIRLVTDIVIFALPIPKLWRLQISVRAKAGLIFVFGLWILVCATSIVRATYLKHINVDYTWDLVHALTWSAVEVCVAIFLACAPSFRVLVAMILPSWRKHTRPLGESKPYEVSSEEHEGNREYDYFSTPVSQRPTIPHDCFPLPSPYIPTPFSPMSIDATIEAQSPTMSGALPSSPATGEGSNHAQHNVG